MKTKYYSIERKAKRITAQIVCAALICAGFSGVNADAQTKNNRLNNPPNNQRNAARINNNAETVWVEKTLRSMTLR
ncbi:MAG: hypothetical protein M3Q99_06225, partial [Acidobacteriota bacterium]|nr:hypothetical protein [Acidobacteriota bacterium]